MQCVIVCSAYDAGAEADFAFQLGSSAACTVVALPQEGAGLFRRAAIGIWSVYLHSRLYPFDISTVAAAPGWHFESLLLLTSMDCKMLTIRIGLVANSILFSFRLQTVNQRHPISFTLQLEAEDSLEDAGHAGPVTDRPSGAVIPLRRYIGTR